MNPVACAVFSLRSLARVLLLATITAAAWLVLGSVEARAAEGPTQAAATVADSTPDLAGTLGARASAASAERTAAPRAAAAVTPAKAARGAPQRRPAAAAAPPTHPVATVVRQRVAASATTHRVESVQQLVPVAAPSPSALHELVTAEVVDATTAQLQAAVRDVVDTATAPSLLPLARAMPLQPAASASAAVPVEVPLGSAGHRAPSGGAPSGQPVDDGAPLARSAPAVAATLFATATDAPAPPPGPRGGVPAQAPAPLGGPGTGSSADPAATARHLDMHAQSGGSGRPADDDLPSSDNERPDTFPD